MRDPKPPSPMNGLCLEDVHIRLNGALLVDMDIEIGPGETVTVMGPSGSGKSSLLALITGTLDRAFDWSGRVVLAGKDITRLAAQARGIGLMMQDHLLFPHLSVGGNLAFGLSRKVKGRQARRARIAQALALAGLDGFIDRDPATLSGGQKARVALLRTLLSEPKALLLDEPFSKLDTGLRDQIRDFVFAQVKERGLPTLLVTHDPDDALRAGGRIIGPIDEQPAVSTTCSAAGSTGH